MNTYRVERTDRQGNVFDRHVITGEAFSVEDNGTLWFYDSAKSDKENVAGVTHVFAPGTWGILTIIDPAEAERLAADSAEIAREAVEWEKRRNEINTITHPVATREEIQGVLDGATITTSNDTYPVTSSAIYNPDNPNSFPTNIHNVYNQVGITRAEVQAEVAQMMRQLD